MSENYVGRKERVAILMSERMREMMIEYKCVNARICWVSYKLGIRKVIFVCVCTGECGKCDWEERDGEILV